MEGNNEMDVEERGRTIIMMIMKMWNKRRFSTLVMIMKIVIILMERMRTNEDVLHLGHSGSAGRPRGTVCLHTTTGETGGGLRPARGNTHYLQSHTHNSNTRARVSQPLLIWFKHNYIHGALLFYFNPSSTCLHFPNFSNTFSPSSQLLTATY